MRKSDGMKWPFPDEDAMDNLIEWAGKIKALGEAWASLSWHVNRYNGDVWALSHCGETLGSIIGDYAGFIEDTVTENMRSSKDDSADSIAKGLARCREVYEFIGDTRRPEDLLAIDCRLNELSAFIIRSAAPAMKLKEDFLSLRNSIIAEQKKEPAAEATAGGA